MQPKQQQKARHAAICREAFDFRVGSISEIRPCHLECPILGQERTTICGCSKHSRFRCVSVTPCPATEIGCGVGGVGPYRRPRPAAHSPAARPALSRPFAWRKTARVWSMSQGRHLAGSHGVRAGGSRTAVLCGAPRLSLPRQLAAGDVGARPDHLVRVPGDRLGGGIASQFERSKLTKK